MLIYFLQIFISQQVFAIGEAAKRLKYVDALMMMMMMMGERDRIKWQKWMYVISYTVYSARNKLDTILYFLTLWKTKFSMKLFNSRSIYKMKIEFLTLTIEKVVIKCSKPVGKSAPSKLNNELYYKWWSFIKLQSIPVNEFLSGKS